MGESGLLYSSFVIPETIGRYTGLTDKNGKKIFEGDIVQYLTYDDFDCQSVVKFGEYKQDGSGGEYGAKNCLGFYVEVDNLLALIGAKMNLNILEIIKNNKTFWKSQMNVK